jgi:hypothetical protein
MSDRKAEEAAYEVARLAYEEACFNWTLDKGNFPVAPVISPPLAYRMASKFDDKYFLIGALENFKKCFEYVGPPYLERPEKPNPLAGKPKKAVGRIGRPTLFATALDRVGLTAAQAAWVMQTASEANILPAEVMRALIDEQIVKDSEAK